MRGDQIGWPQQEGELVELQGRLGMAAARALVEEPWMPQGDRTRFAACFVAYARGTTGPGRAGDQAWAAAVVWGTSARAPEALRRADRHLRGSVARDGPRRADDVLAQSVVADRVPAPYRPGLLAWREGPILAAALAGLGVPADVVLIDASGMDHPRGAGLAVHVGAAFGLPSVGVTRRPLVAVGRRPALERGATAPLHVGDRCVAFWVCTRTGAQPVVAHAGWRTSPEIAARVVLASSTPAARTPVPLQEARRVAREARSLADPDRGDRALRTVRYSTGTGPYRSGTEPYRSGTEPYNSSGDPAKGGS